ncbi:MAG: HAD-IA family hydrolase [Alphaproteobacteria bacterium]|nr:HAD-IA family hydrolase [Alphaproteobacteria bacterium]
MNTPRNGARDRLVLFDFDGTLVDSQRSIVDAFAAACREHDLGDVDPRAIRRFIGLPLAVAIAECVPERHRERAAALAESYKQAHRSLAAGSADHDPLFPGASAALHVLSGAGALLGIATGKGRRGLTATLEKHGLSRHFVVLRTADDGPGKPDPFMAISALDATGVHKDDAIMVGDTAFDMQMARNAGIAAIGVGWGYHGEDDLMAAGAESVVPTFDTLLATLRRRGFPA